MTDLDIGQTTTTDFSGTIRDFSVRAEMPDAHGEQKESYWDFPDAAKHLGYYKTIPEIYSMINALAIWTAGKGFEADNRTKSILDSINGWGEDSAQTIFMKLVREKKIFGDAFAEIIRNKKGTLINIKPLYTGDMRVVVDGNGIILRYEQTARTPGTEPKVFQPDKILHVSNNRVANEMHGMSVVDVLKFIIDAKQEALNDERTIRHREMLGILELDTDDSTKIADAVKKVQDAYKKKEVLVTMKGVSEFKDVPFTTKDRLQWLQYLDNLFYQVGGVPKVIATSEGFTEAGGKIGFLTFEPIYTSEQTELEADLWNQLAIKVKFNRPPSLAGMMKESEEKNTGQTGIQPNETQVTPTRTE